MGQLLVADEIPFDPLSLDNIGFVLAVEMLSQPLYSLPPSSFAGAGVYALYYGGPHPAYGDLVNLDRGKWRYPIYVGQATSAGFSLGATRQRRIHERLKNHAKSIEQAENLSLTDFRCRYLVINDAHIALAESVLIAAFRPTWNGMGLGSKVVGKNRMEGAVSLWDSVHPGRGGRPTGAERAEEGAVRVRESIAALTQEPADPRMKWMLERIRKFL
jgi:Eco29kI restriction endonuclease